MALRLRGLPWLSVGGSANPFAPATKSLLLPPFTLAIACRGRLCWPIVRVDAENPPHRGRSRKSIARTQAADAGRIRSDRRSRRARGDPSRLAAAAGSRARGHRDPWPRRLRGDLAPALGAEAAWRAHRRHHGGGRSRY